MKSPKVKTPKSYEPKPIPTTPMKWGGMKKPKGKC